MYKIFLDKNKKVIGTMRVHNTPQELDKLHDKLISCASSDTCECCVFYNGNANCLETTLFKVAEAISELRGSIWGERK